MENNNKLSSILQGFNIVHVFLDSEDKKVLRVGKYLKDRSGNKIYHKMVVKIMKI
jgi:hypothetical protein